MSRKQTRICLFLSVACCLWLAQAQENTAKVTGTITDSNGGSVANAPVKLENLERGVSHISKSDGNGRFSFDFVPVGSYSLTVEQPGFRTAVRQGIHLAAGQNLDLPVQLTVANVATSLVVSADSAVLDTITVEQRATIGVAQVNGLPVQHQDWTSLLSLSAGTTKPTGASTTTSVSNGGTGMNINGLPQSGYNLTVDGTNATSNPEFTSFSFYQAPNIINTVNNDAIEEVSLARGIPPATVGNTMSGNINIVTKSATNTVHGSGFEVNEVSLYDARNHFLTARPRTTFNEYGGSVGGPILKNRLFFLGSYEGARLRAAKALTATVPTPYLASISPAVYSSIFSLYPTVSQPSNNPTALTTQYYGTGTTDQKDGNAVGRVDYAVNQNSLLAIRYIRARPILTAPAVIESNSRVTLGHTDAVNLTYTHSSSRLTENVRVGYNKLKLTRIDNGYPTQLPAISFGFNTSGSSAFLQHGSYTTIEPGAAFSIGRHTVQFGVIFQGRTASRYKLATPNITYSTLAQFQADTPSAITLQLYSLPAGTPDLGYNDYQAGGYVQDDIRLASRLTLNLGLRYDVFTVPREYHGRAFNRDVDPAAPALGPGFGPYRSQDSIFNGDHNNLQPRVGLAYTPFASGRTVLRAGFGVLTEGHNLFSGPVAVVSVSTSLPYTLSLSQSQIQAAALKYPIDAAQYPQQLSQLQALGVISSTFANQGALNPNFPDPYSLEWMLGIQQALPQNFTLEVDYNANRGLHEFFQEVVNLADRVTGVSPRANFGSFAYYTPVDRSKYSGLQATLAKRMHHGVLLGLAYTWSRVSAFGDADLLQPLAPQDNNNIKADWGPTPFDIRQRVVAHGLFEPAIDKWVHANGPLGHWLLKGWKLSAVFSAQTGLPVNLTNTSSTYPADRPDANGASPYLSGFGSGVHQYLDKSAFTMVSISSLSGAQVRAGNLGRYALRAPGVVNLDASLAKAFAFRERFNLQLHADTFNTLNHTNLSGLVTTINTSTFGRLTTATARTMQLGARLTF